MFPFPPKHWRRSVRGLVVRPGGRTGAITGGILAKGSDAVYLSPLAENTAAFLRGEAERLRWYPRPFDEMVEHWRTRWLLPRAARDNSFRAFDKSHWNEIAGLSARASEIA